MAEVALKLQMEPTGLGDGWTWRMREVSAVIPRFLAVVTEGKRCHLLSQEEELI